MAAPFEIKKIYVTIEDRIKVIRANSQKSHSIRKRFLMAYKAERGCIICGENDPVCLDLHHRIPADKHRKLVDHEKSGWKGSWMRLNMKILLEELKKVDVLCSNCHRKVHKDEQEPFMRKVAKGETYKKESSLYPMKDERQGSFFDKMEPY